MTALLRFGLSGISPQSKEKFVSSSIQLASFYHVAIAMTQYTSQLAQHTPILEGAAKLGDPPLDSFLRQAGAGVIDTLPDFNAKLNFLTKPPHYVGLPCHVTVKLAELQAALSKVVASFWLNSGKVAITFHRVEHNPNDNA